MGSPGSGSVRPAPPPSAGPAPDRPRAGDPAGAPGVYEASTVPKGKFVEANAAYQIAPDMTRNRSTTVDLWIDARLTQEQLVAQLQAYLQENAQKARVRVKHRKLDPSLSAPDGIASRGIVIANVVSAELSGSDRDFQIKPLGPQKITARADMPLKWQWMVTPLRASDEGLPLTLSVVVDPGDGGTPLTPILETVVVRSDSGWWDRVMEFIKALDPLLKFILTLAAVLPVLAGALAWLCRKSGAKRGICARLRSGPPNSP